MNSAPNVQINYSTLDGVRNRFQHQCETLTHISRHLEESTTNLHRGGWEGEGSEAFFREMNEQVLPRLKKLNRAFEDIQGVLQHIILHFQEAEVEARHLLESEPEEITAPIKTEGFAKVQGAALYSQTIAPRMTNAQANFSPPSSSAQANFSPPPPSELKTGLNITAWKPVSGVLGLRSIAPTDVNQGNLGDGFLLGALGSLAQQNPAVLQKAIQDNADGTYTVTFQKPSPGGGFEPVPVTVNSDVPQGTYVGGGHTSAVAPHAHVPKGGGHPPIWPIVAEKAYARYVGEGNTTKGYRSIGKGGSAAQALEAFTGQPSRIFRPRSRSLLELAQLHRDRHALLLGTPPKGDSRLAAYQNGELVGRQTYYVVDVDTQQQTVTLRNPWGWGEKGARVTLLYEQLDEHFQYLIANP